jgi:hypothetical protein
VTLFALDPAITFAVIGLPPNRIVDGSIRRLWTFCVRTTKACASVVPMKFVAGFVPPLPVRLQPLAVGAGPQPTVPSALTCWT